MFYSQTFLARKGPLGTVWCAAHLQHRLKKSHYKSTDVPKTVDLIMFPEVPLALRMSGHLLLGVVRIYSKKVDYLFHDCNVALTSLAKAFASSKVDLPEETRQAPVESVTLLVTSPEKLNLDDFNIDDDTLESDTDSHRKSQEEITLTDQIPTDTDPYVAITFDEDIFEDFRLMDVDCTTVPLHNDPDNVTRETDVAISTKDAEPYIQPGAADVAVDPKVSVPNNETEEIAVNIEFQDSRPSNLTEMLDAGNSNTNSPRSAPEIERMRDAVHDLSPGIQLPFAPDQMNDTVELTECLDETLNEKENLTPAIEEETLRSGGHSPLQPHSESPAFAVHEEEPVNFGHSSPQLALRSTPPPAQQQPELRPKKRKLLFDKRKPVLSNRIMRARLDDTSDTLRRRRNLPSCQLEIWRHNNWTRKEQIFNEPLLNGFSDELRSIFEKDYIASKPHLVVADTESMATVSPIRETEINPEFAAVQSPTVVLPHTQETETAAIPEFTVLQSPRSATEANLLDERVQQSPTQNTDAIPEFTVPQSSHPGSEPTMAQSYQSLGDIDMEIECLRDSGFPEFVQSPTGFSPVRTDEFTPRFGTSGTTTTATPAFTAETASYETESETPKTIPEDLPGPRTTGLSDIPEIDEELSFLETGGDTPTASPVTQRSDALSVRSRALAQYLKHQSSSSPSSKGSSEDLSLSKILEGKTRKLAARMFFETLVLKTNRLIDVQQVKPYDDIRLKLLPALFSRAQL